MFMIGLHILSSIFLQCSSYDISKNTVPLVFHVLPLVQRKGLENILRIGSVRRWLEIFGEVGNVRRRFTSRERPLQNKKLHSNFNHSFNEKVIFLGKS